MNKRAYAIVIAGFFTVGIAYGIRYGYGMLLPEMIASLGISKTQAGTIFAFHFVTYTLATPLLGSLTDFYNYRFILTLFTVVLAGGAMLMATASSFLIACLVFSLAGLGHAACWAPVMALVSKWVPDNRRGTALSIVTMGIGLSLPVWGFVLPKIVSHWNWQAGWLAMGFYTMGVALLNFILVRNPLNIAPPAITAHSQIARILDTYSELLRNKTFWILGMAYLMIGFNVLVPFTFLPVYTRETLDFAYSTSTRFPAIIAVFGIAGQLILGTLSDSMGKIKVLMICGTFMGLACLGMVYFTDAWWLFAATAFYGVGYGAIWPVFAATAADYFPKGKTGSVVGLWTAYLGLGSIISPVICGWTIDTTGSYRWTFLLGLISGLMTVLTLAMVSKPAQQQNVALMSPEGNR